MKPPSHFSNNAFKILRVTVSGSATVLLSTFTSCYLAVMVEKTAHRVQYHFFPQLYRDVDFALGLDLHKEKIHTSNNEFQNDHNTIIDTKDENIDEIHYHQIDNLQEVKDKMNESILYTCSTGDKKNSRIQGTTLFSTATTATTGFQLGGYEQNYAFDRDTIPISSSSSTKIPLHTSKDTQFESPVMQTNYLDLISNEEPVPPITVPYSNNSDKSTTPSKIKSFLELVGSNSSENVTNVLQSCAMTA